MASSLSRIIRPPQFYETSDENHIITLGGRDVRSPGIPYQWQVGARDSIEGLCIVLEDARDYALYRKVGVDSWDEYCAKFLSAPASGIDELIEGVRILRGRGVKKISEEAAKQAAAEQRRQLVEKAPDLPKRELGTGKAGPGRGKKTADDVSRLSYGNSTDYLAARIKRDAPEIAAKIDSYPSIRAAARAAGIIRKQTPLQRLKAAWNSANSDERAAFLADIGVGT